MSHGHHGGGAYAAFHFLHRRRGSRPPSLWRAPVTFVVVVLLVIVLR